MCLNTKYLKRLLTKDVSCALACDRLQGLVRSGIENSTWYEAHVVRHKKGNSKRCTVHTVSSIDKDEWCTIWKKAPQHFRYKVCVIERGHLERVLEQYLLRVGFCSHCSSNVVYACDVLFGEAEVPDEFDPQLYRALEVDENVRLFV